MIVLVPTYNRPHLFARLVDDLARELEPGDLLFVVDDCSATSYAFDALATHEGMQRLTWRLVRTPEHNGKRGYWRTVNQLLDLATAAEGRLSDEIVAYLADDLRLVDGWREQAEYWHTHARRLDPKCIGLHAHRDGRHGEWGLTGGIHYDEHGDRMCWQDGIWTAPRFALDVIRPQEVHRDWHRRPYLGSGAWRSSSYRTHAQGLWWYRPNTKLCWHDDEGVSVMNPDATASEKRRAARKVYTKE